jgi:hypothetical protein
VPYTLKPLLELVNASVREGIHIKKVVVKLVYKKTKEDSNSNHLITFILVLSMIIEKIIANQLLSFLDKRYILNKSVSI